MEQKTKFIIIGLIGVLAVVFVLFVGTMGQKQSLLKDRDMLKAENTRLSANVRNLERSLSDSKSRIDSLQGELSSIARERDDLQARYDLASKAQQDLMEKMKSMQERGAPRQQLQVLPGQTDAYWAGVLKAKTDLELQLGNVGNQLRSAQILNEQLQREKSTLEIEMSNLMREKEEVRRELEYNKKILDSVSQELVRERNDKIQIQESFRSIKSENTALTRQLASLNNRKVNLEKRIQDLEMERDGIERRFSEMQTMLTGKISQVNELHQELDAIRKGVRTETPVVLTKESVELPPIVVRPQGMSSVKAAGVAFEGKVLAVNKENNFVIIDLGEEAGIKVGDVFEVTRDGKSVATVEAMQVRKNITACDIKRQDLAVSVGDTIK